MDLQNDFCSSQQPANTDNCNGFPPLLPSCPQCGAWSKLNTRHHSPDIQVKSKEPSHVEEIFSKFESIKDSPVPDHVMDQLKSLTFNSWVYDEADLLSFLQSMFSELDLIEEFKIETPTLQRWLMKIYTCYNDVPFHNFKHCFCVTQMTYALIHLMGLRHKMLQLDVFTLLFSAICHDLDHPGFNNTFQVNSVSKLSLIYNDSSPLENHHCSTAFRIVLDDPVNILKNMDTKYFASFRKGVIKCILATDMAKHDAIMSEFLDALSGFDYTNVHHRNLLMMVIIKLADISNEMRSTECSTRWMDCLFREYFHQSDIERENGLPVTPFMDRNRVNKSQSQVNFIKTFLLPSLKSLAQLERKLEDAIAVVENNLKYYQEQASKANE